MLVKFSNNEIKIGNSSVLNLHNIGLSPGNFKIYCQPYQASKLDFITIQDEHKLDR